MKKILFKVSHFPQPSETFVTSQLITAINCGYAIKLLTKELIIENIQSQQGIINDYNLLDKIVIEDVIVPKLKIKRYFNAFLIIVKHIKNFKRVVNFSMINNNFRVEKIFEFDFYKQFSDFDIIHIQFGNNHQPFEQLIESNILKSKLVVSFHGHDAFFPINGCLKENYYDMLFKNANLIVTNTPYLETQLIKIGCDIKKIISIPVGVDVEFFKPKKIKKDIDKKNIKLVTLGRLDKVKGHSYAIQVVDSLVDKGFNVKLIIIGEGKERENLTKMIKQKNLSDKVFLVGMKSHDSVLKYFKKSDFFIFTSVAVENSRRETQGLAVVEAQAAGLPVIVFDSGGVKYTMKNDFTGFLINEYDVNGMAEKIISLINDDDKRITMSRNSISFSEENFSNQRLDKIWCKVYSKL